MTDDDPRTVADAELTGCIQEMRTAITALELELPAAVWHDVADRWTRLHVAIAERWDLDDDDSRTVSDVTHSKCWTAALDALGVDPDMPYSVFRRRLELGERAERALAEFDQPIGPHAATCLSYIRGDLGA